MTIMSIQDLDPAEHGISWRISPYREISLNMRPKQREDLDSITREVAERDGLTIKDLHGRSRLRALCRARFEIWYRAYQLRTPRGERRYSYQMIADAVGRENHTTIKHGVDSHAARIAAGEVSA